MALLNKQENLNFDIVPYWNVCTYLRDMDRNHPLLLLLAVRVPDAPDVEGGRLAGSPIDSGWSWGRVCHHIIIWSLSGA